VALIAVPHAAQNFAPDKLLVPQVGQIIVLLGVGS